MKAPKNRGISRRRFLRSAVLGAAVAAGQSLRPLSAIASPRGVGTRRETVAVFGGGIAGLTAAHELAERGFDVTVYERRAWGGKARSMDIPNTAAGGRQPLPAEHGLRFEFGWYRNLPDTLKRIPFGSNANGVFDNMAVCPEFGFARVGRQSDLLIPCDLLHPASLSPEHVLETVSGLLLETRLPPQAVAHLASRVAVFFSSCDERRWNEWESTSWTHFIAADRYGGDYRDILNDIPRLGQASKPERTSAEWVGQAMEGLLYTLIGRGSTGPLWRTMNAPTNEAWIDPWVAELRRLGVDLQLGQTLDGFDMEDGRIAGAHLNTPNGRRRCRADWYVSALPLERAREFWSPSILAADPDLARMSKLEANWMNGMKFFLREEPGIARGPMICAGSPWAITSMGQAQFWAPDFAGRYGDGTVQESLTVIISDWTEPGPLFGKPAQDCTPEEVAIEIWEMLKTYSNKSGERPRLTDDTLVSWDIDPGMLREGGRLVSEDPLAIPTVGSRPDRPEPGTAIPNLVLAGDYLRSELLVGTMEQANESGRRACNVILDRSGSKESPSAVFARYRPPEWEPLKRVDEALFHAGQRNLFDVSPFGSP